LDDVDGNEAWASRSSPPVVVGPEGLRRGPASVTAHRIPIGPAQVVHGVKAVPRDLAAGQGLDESARPRTGVHRVRVPSALA
ncbi:hypothetical protein ABE10_00505, partial [Bacillus toyonensis]|nr:hypothetical protein [Bacillus toyonensis]